ncbi:P-loop containing nucleoside triphosphate hydrolase protein, partial [Infundibulicybe gibba]
IVILSPEMLLSKKFVNGVLRNSEMANRILSVVVDEAHVISHWGSGFRKKYGSLGVLRALLPKGTPIVAMSATLSPRVRRDLLSKLQYGNDYVNINLGNDRQNVSIVIRAIQNNMNTYSDLDFLIPDGTSEVTQIPKTFIYADNIGVGVEIEDRLYECCDARIRGLGIIRPYNAAYSAEYRARVMQLFKDGDIRILICTDAAGMGCNIPDVDVVVQWKLPASVSSFVQRAGRAARAKNHTGLAVLLVEKSIYDADLSKIDQSPQNKLGNAKTSIRKGATKPGVHQPGTYPKATKGYAVRHGSKRGAHGGQDDGILNSATEVAIDVEAPDEGLYSFLVQTGQCRRLILTKIFRNEMPTPTVPCCDICDPSLLNRTRPSKAQRVGRVARVFKRGQPNETVKSTLHKWRTLVVERDFPSTLFGASGLLKDETIELLASIGPIESLEYLERVLAGRWTWFSIYGSELYSQLQELTIP